jgi:hypothetical protein
LLALACDEMDVGRVGVAFCELATTEAAAMVREGMCHAAAVAHGTSESTAEIPPLIAVRLAECDVGLSVASFSAPPTGPQELLLSGVRVAVGPAGSPGRRVLDEQLDAIGPSLCEILETRSDAASLATLVGGYADCAIATIPAARRAGLRPARLGRSAIDLMLHRDVAKRDPAVDGLLATIRSKVILRRTRSRSLRTGESVSRRTAAL